MGEEVPGAGRQGESSLSRQTGVFLLNSHSLDSSLFLRPTSAQVAATIALPEKDIFLVERALSVNKFDKGVHTVEFKVPVDRGGGRVA